MGKITNLDQTWITEVSHENILQYYLLPLKLRYEINSLIHLTATYSYVRAEINVEYIVIIELK